MSNLLDVYVLDRMVGVLSDQDSSMCLTIYLTRRPVIWSRSRCQCA
jgi:hypothetical protein